MFIRRPAAGRIQGSDYFTWQVNLSRGASRPIVHMWLFAGFEAVGPFIITLALIPFLAIGVLKLINMMLVDRSITPLTGFGGIGILFGQSGVVIASGSFVLAGILSMAMIVAYVFHPFAEKMLAGHQFAQISGDQIEKLYEGYAANPQNYAIAFRLAQELYEGGMMAEGVCLAKTTAATMPDVAPDAFSQRSIKHMFDREIRQIKYWEANVKPNDWRAKPCPRCSMPVGPEILNCPRCNCAVLLERVRAFTGDRSFGAKLLLAYLIVMVTIVACGFLATTGANTLVMVGVAVTVCGVSLWLLFRRLLGGNGSLWRVGEPD